MWGRLPWLCVLTSIAVSRCQQRKPIKAYRQKLAVLFQKSQVVAQLPQCACVAAWFLERMVPSDDMLPGARLPLNLPPLIPDLRIVAWVWTWPTTLYGGHTIFGFAWPHFATSKVRRISFKTALCGVFVIKPMCFPSDSEMMAMGHVNSVAIYDYQHASRLFKKESNSLFTYD